MESQCMTERVCMEGRERLARHRLLAASSFRGDKGAVCLQLLVAGVICRHEVVLCVCVCVCVCGIVCSGCKHPQAGDEGESDVLRQSTHALPCTGKMAAGRTPPTLPQRHTHAHPSSRCRCGSPRPVRQPQRRTCLPGGRGRGV